MIHDILNFLIVANLMVMWSLNVISEGHTLGHRNSDTGC